MEKSDRPRDESLCRQQFDQGDHRINAGEYHAYEYRTGDAIAITPNVAE